jgi:hypothetical protein
MKEGLAQQISFVVKGATTFNDASARPRLVAEPGDVGVSFLLPTRFNDNRVAIWINDRDIHGLIGATILVKIRSASTDGSGR